MMRICSLLPSATEMVFALGKGDSLVGVTHECDFPPEALNVPKVTRSLIPTGLSSDEIDAHVSAALETEGTLYELDESLLEQLRPDLILTQRLCSVCAVSFDRVQEFARSFNSQPRILNLEPHSLEEILDNLTLVSEAVGAEAQGSAFRASLEQRIETARRRTASLGNRPRVFCMEWVNPPYCGGHWMKELVEIAGGVDGLAIHQRPSVRIPWEQVVAFAPEIIVLTCCGFSLDRCKQEAALLSTYEGFRSLPAAKAGNIFATDGSAYFSRPGPRMVEGLEILGHLIQPQIFPRPALESAFARVVVQ